MPSIRVENCRDDGGLIEIVEQFGDHCVHRRLRPGEVTRISLDGEKSVQIDPIARRWSLGLGRSAPRVAPPQEAMPSLVRTCRDEEF